VTWRLSLTSKRYERGPGVERLPIRYRKRSQIDMEKIIVEHLFFSQEQNDII